jgi:hypothetical protein
MDDFEKGLKARYDIEIAQVKRQESQSRPSDGQAQTGPEPAAQTTNAAAAPEKIQRGKRCAQIIDEVRRVKNLVVGTGRTMAEVREEQPTLLVWAFRDTLPQQDREIFDHPNQWGPVVGYAHGLLSKEYGKSPTTIKDWVKAFRHHERQRRAPSR